MVKIIGLHLGLHIVAPLARWYGLLVEYAMFNGHLFWYVFVRGGGLGGHFKISFILIDGLYRKLWANNHSQMHEKCFQTWIFLRFWELYIFYSVFNWLYK